MSSHPAIFLRCGDAGAFRNSPAIAVMPEHRGIATGRVARQSTADSGDRRGRAKSPSLFGGHALPNAGDVTAVVCRPTLPGRTCAVPRNAHPDPPNQGCREPRAVRTNPTAAGQARLYADLAPNGRNEKTRLRGFDHLLSHGAQERTRTSTKLPPLAPEASASTNSATWATQETNCAGEPRMCQQHFAINTNIDRALRRNEKTRLRGFDHLLSHGAQERTRTSTKLPPLAPEASASTNSATWATQAANYAEAFGGCQRIL